MNSVDKLREWSHRYDNGWIQDDGSILLTTDTHGVYYGENYGESIRSMIDEIEAEAAERERLLKQSESATEDYYKDMIAEEFMPLPKDADGVPIHVGDKLQYHGGKPFTVCAVAQMNVHTFVAVKLGEPQTTVNYPPDQCTHYHAPTVEDVLREYSEEYQMWLEHCDGSATCNTPLDPTYEYADKIRKCLEDECA